MFRYLFIKLWIFIGFFFCLYFIFFIGGVVCVLGRLGCLVNSVIEDVVSGRLWIVVSSDWMYWIGGWLCECCGFFYLKLNIKFIIIIKVKGYGI